MSLNEQFYFLSPVLVVKVTKQNIHEVAEWCGGKVAKAPSRRHPDKMDDYVWVPTPENSRTSAAFVGYYVTKRCVMTTQGELKTTWAVFSGHYFEKNYFETPSAAVDATWAKKDPKMEKPEAVKPQPQVVQNIYVQDSKGDAVGEQVKQALANVPRDAAL